jgi:hypothetical protein
MKTEIGSGQIKNGLSHRGYTGSHTCKNLYFVRSRKAIHRKIWTAIPMVKAKWFLAAGATATVLVIFTGGIWFRVYAPSVARDYEECAEQAEASLVAQRAPLLIECGARFAGRRKPGVGYSYYDFMQNRSFDIAGPNPTADERKQIDQEYMKYLDSARRDVLSAELAQQQNNIPVADAGSIPTTVGQPIGPPIVPTPKKVQSTKSAANRSKNAPAPCPEGSFVCSWQRLASTVRNAFASSAKPE